MYWFGQAFLSQNFAMAALGSGTAANGVAANTPEPVFAPTVNGSLTCGTIFSNPSSSGLFESAHLSENLASPSDANSAAGLEAAFADADCLPTHLSA
jgi:hypothetical protein